MKQSLIFSIFFLFTNLFCFAQNEFDEVYLEDGTTLTGHITNYEQGKALYLQLDSGEEITIQDRNISKIVEGLAIEPVKQAYFKNQQNELPNYKVTGWYNSTFVSFAGGEEEVDGDTNFKLGSGFHNITGKQFSSLFGLGLGVGLDNYSRRGQTVFPVYLELRGYPLKNRQFYYAVSGGWGFTFKRESFGIQDTDGGYYFNPNIGFRIGTPDGTNVNIDLGYKVQKAFFVERLINGDVDERNVVFNRITLRVGLTLWK